MKRFFIIAAMFLSCATGFAQWEDFNDHNWAETEEVKVGYNKEWYSNKIVECENVVNKDLGNEKAWYNLFLASLYFDECGNHSKQKKEKNDSYPKTDDVLNKMKKAIPESDVYCQCLTMRNPDGPSEHLVKLLHRQLTRDNRTKDPDIIKFQTLKLWRLAPDDSAISNGFQTLYDNRHYTERIMRYGWNMLSSMKEGAIYIADEWYEYEQMKLMQEVLNERKDVIIVPYKFLSSQGFCDGICKRLKIEPMPFNKNEKINDAVQVTEFVKHVTQNCSNPVYFSLNMATRTCLNPDSLYNEGLLLKYSSKRYDNINVALQNYKEVYDINYLLQPVFVRDDDMKTTIRVDNNVLFCLSCMVKKFNAAGHNEEAKRLETFVNKVYNKDYEGKYRSEKAFYILRHIKN